VLVMKQHALVTVDDKDLVVIHSLTQLAVRGQTDKGDRRALAAAVARALEGRLAKFDHEKPEKMSIIYDGQGHYGQVLGVYKVCSGNQDPRMRPRLPERGRLLQQRCLYLHESRQVPGGTRNAHEITRNQDPHLRRQAPKRGRLVQRTRECLQQTRSVRASVGVLSERPRHHSPAGRGDHLDVAASYNGLGNVYDSLGQYEEALEYYQKSLDIKIRVVGGDQLDVAASYNNVAIIYEAQGKREEALAMHAKSLDIRTRILHRWRQPPARCRDSREHGQYLLPGRPLRPSP
jgi:tetratricopeptide (TPR) repeat protein